MENIRNIYCIGRNYKLHAEELGNEVPKEPLVFTKPTHALISASGTVKLPQNVGEIHHEIEIVLAIGRNLTASTEEEIAALNVEDIVDKFALGIDFTLRDVQNKLKEKGLPWLKAKGFKNSAVITPWQRFDLERLLNNDFSLQVNDREVQRGNIKEMIFDLKRMITYIALNFGLGKGDIIFTGTPNGVGPVQINDRLTLFFGDNSLGEFIVG